MLCAASAGSTIAARARGVGRHHEVVGEAPLEAEARAPRRPCTGSCPCRSTRANADSEMPQGTRRAAAYSTCRRTARRQVRSRRRVGVAPHQQHRHEVLEHGGAPGQQHRGPVDAGHGPAEVEPVRLGHVLLGDGDEARETRLGGEEVVARAVEPARAFGVGQPIADGEEPSARVVEEREVHGVGQGQGAAARTDKPRVRAPPAARGTARDLAWPHGARSQYADSSASSGVDDPGVVRSPQSPRPLAQERMSRAGVVACPRAAGAIGRGPPEGEPRRCAPRSTGAPRPGSAGFFARPGYRPGPERPRS